MVTPEELKRLRELCDAATGGEWQRYGHIGSGSLARVRAIVGKCERTHREMFQDVPSDGNDAAFIAAARTALPALLDEVERLKAELAKVREVIDARIGREINSTEDLHDYSVRKREATVIRDASTTGNKSEVSRG